MFSVLLVLTICIKVRLTYLLLSALERSLPMLQVGLWFLRFPHFRWKETVFLDTSLCRIGGRKISGVRSSFTTFLDKVAKKEERKEEIEKAHFDYGSTLSAIGGHLRLQYATMGRTIKPVMP